MNVTRSIHTSMHAICTVSRCFVFIRFLGGSTVAHRGHASAHEYTCPILHCLYLQYITNGVLHNYIGVEFFIHKCSYRCYFFNYMWQPPTFTHVASMFVPSKYTVQCYSTPPYRLENSLHIIYGFILNVVQGLCL